MAIRPKACRQFSEGLGRGVLKTASVPKRGRKLRPKPHQSEIGGDDLDALPKFVPQSVRLFRMKIDFAVQTSFAAADLQPDGSEQFPGLFDDLKFLEPLLQILPRQVLLLP